MTYFFSFFIVFITVNFLDSNSLLAQDKVFGPNTFDVKTIDSSLKVTQKTKYSLIKRREADTIYYYAMTKNTEELLSAQIRVKKSGTLISFYLINGILMKVNYTPKKMNNTRTGGIYYFKNGELIYKEEYNISAQETSKFFSLADHLIQKSSNLN